MSTNKTGMVIRYGMQWPASWPQVEIEKNLFLNQDQYRKDFPEVKYEPREHHFKQIVATYWGPNNKKHYVWNPWNERMLREACKNEWLWLSGCAASQKSTFLAIWGLVNWLCAPEKTLVMITSTSLKESRMRVWGQVEDFFNDAGFVKNQWGRDEDAERILPGKLVSSSGKIVSVIGDQVMPDHYGLHLIPGEKSQEKESIGKLIGMHNERVFLLADELPELSPAVVQAGKANLAVNRYFQMIGSGNFKSVYDPFGMEVEPKKGWGSVTLEDEEWECNQGKCIRFDGLKSPNVILGYNRYPGLYGPKDLANHQKLGEHTLQFWRMCRSFVCQVSDADHIYAEADLIRGEVHATVKWRQQPIALASLDPAFATGGDKAIATFGLLGISMEGKRTLQISEQVELREDVRLQDQSRTLQVAMQFRDECYRRHVDAENAAYDGSGGGLPFGALLTEIWSPKVLAVLFGGSASNNPASVKDKRAASKVYTNRVTELWFGGVDFIQSGQIKGMSPELAKQLKERKYDTVKGPSGLRLRAEAKDVMKNRTNGVSPDEADSFTILLALAKERHGFQAVGMEAAREKLGSSWTAFSKKFHGAQGEGTYEEENEEVEA